ncbi:MAG: DUF1932 domain-containing protein [Woeseia sp.]
MKTLKTIGLLGFGEVGQRLADDLSALPDVSLCAWDVQFRTEGSGDRAALARYMILRSVRHGERRNEEMREVAETVEEAGLEPWMSRASARRQEWASQFKAALDCEDLDSVLDSIRSEMRC